MTAILLISCQDRKGIVAGITNFIYQNNGNIEHADQHIDSQSKTFFMRIEWSLDDFKIPPQDIEKSFSFIFERFNMKYSLYFTDEKPRLAIFVSKRMHCLYDLLLRYQEGQFKCKIPLIISNYPLAERIAKNFNINFYFLPKDKENREEVEKKEIFLLKKENIELVVLARYNRIFTKRFIDEFPNRIINIHHSFLPAFVGSRPYEQAYKKGVKIIGATSHYVVEELDAGPIIEQDVIRVSHRDSLEDLRRKGQDLEKVVLSRAVKWHLERKILVYNNKTVIFD
jgi:formyltetrahydrofolate deformylase